MLRTTLRVAAIVAGGGALLVATWLGLTRELGSRELAANLSFRGERLERSDFREAVVATGRIEPQRRVLVKSEVSGMIRSVLVDEGARVERGQPLFELDRERLEDRTRELAAALEAARANAQYDLVGRASLEVEQAERDHSRTAELSRRGVTSRRELEDSEFALKLARVTLTDARAEKAARNATVAQAEHLLRQAERDLERAVIRAPIDGLLVERHVELGAVVADVTSNGGTGLAAVADDRHIRLVAEVDENDIAPVRVGQTAQVTIDAFPDEVFPGTVIKVSSSGRVERNASNFEIDIELPRDERLRVGMSADARVSVREYRDALVVPNRAIVRGSGRPQLRVSDAAAPEGFRLVDVKTAYSDGFYTVVEQGMSEGDEVLVPTDGEQG